MYGNKHKGRASLPYLTLVIFLALILTACTSSTPLPFHWITPVAPSETAVDAAPAPGTPEPAAAATVEEAAGEAAEEVTGEEDAAAGEEAAAEHVEIAAETDDAQPSPITHKLERREECSDCHAVDDKRNPAPADHVGFTDELCLFCHMPEEGEAALPPLPEKAEGDFCLACHGPYEELLARSEGYTTADGLEANPHMPVPHDKADPAKCNLCHEVHPLPVTDEVQIEPADIEYCFKACHHENDFTPCSECH